MIAHLREASQRVRKVARGPETEWLQMPLDDLEALLDVAEAAQAIWDNWPAARRADGMQGLWAALSRLDTDSSSGGAA